MIGFHQSVIPNRSTKFNHESVKLGAGAAAKAVLARKEIVTAIKRTEPFVFVISINKL